MKDGSSCFRCLKGKKIQLEFVQKCDQDLGSNLENKILNKISKQKCTLIFGKLMLPLYLLHGTSKKALDLSLIVVTLKNILINYNIIITRNIYLIKK